MRGRRNGRCEPDAPEATTCGRSRAVLGEGHCGTCAQRRPRRRPSQRGRIRCSSVPVLGALRGPLSFRRDRPGDRRHCAYDRCCRRHTHHHRGGREQGSCDMFSCVDCRSTRSRAQRDKGGLTALTHSLAGLAMARTSPCNVCCSQSRTSLVHFRGRPAGLARGIHNGAVPEPGAISPCVTGTCERGYRKTGRPSIRPRAILEWTSQDQPWPCRSCMRGRPA